MDELANQIAPTIFDGRALAPAIEDGRAIAPDEKDVDELLVDVFEGRALPEQDENVDNNASDADSDATICDINQTVHCLKRSGQPAGNLPWYDACMSGDMARVDAHIAAEPTRGVDTFNWNLALALACMTNNRSLIELAIARGATTVSWAFLGACRGGHVDLVEEMLATDGRVPQSGLARRQLSEHILATGAEYAARRDNIAVIQLLIGRGVQSLGDALSGAAQKGRMAMVRLLEPHILPAEWARMRSCWTCGLWSACYGGNLEIIHMFINHGVRDWANGLIGALKAGRLDIAEMMVTRGATRASSQRTRLALSTAITIGSMPGVRLVIDRLTHGRELKTVNAGLHNACRHGRIDVVALMIELGANDWNSALHGACYGDHISIAENMIANGATKLANVIWAAESPEMLRMLVGRMRADASGTLTISVRRGILSTACRIGDLEMARLALGLRKSKLATSRNLFSACHSGHADIVRLLIANGAGLCGNCKRTGPEHLVEPVAMGPCHLRVIERGFSDDDI